MKIKFISELMAIFLFTGITVNASSYWSDFKEIEAAIYTENQNNWIDKPDGSYEKCFEVYSEFNNTKEPCDIFAEAEVKGYNKCMSKRVKGSETKEGLTAIKNICSTEGQNEGKSAVDWYRRKSKLKSLFK